MQVVQLDTMKPSSTVMAVGLYCACSSSMLIVNKLAVAHIRAPAFVTFAQFAATALAVKVAHMANFIEVDSFDSRKLMHFSIYVFGFAAGTWTNMRVLMTTNVETVIVFRTIAPLAVAVFDYVFHGRDLPSLRSCLAMGIIVAGALSYVLNDKSFAVSGLRAYVWVVVWLCFLIFNLTYGKYLVSGLGVSSWTAVQYNNTLSMLPTLLFGLLGGEVDKLQAVEWTTRGLLWLAASCVVGLGAPLPCPGSQQHGRPHARARPDATSTTRAQPFQPAPPSPDDGPRRGHMESTPIDRHLIRRLQVPVAHLGDELHHHRRARCGRGRRPSPPRPPAPHPSLRRPAAGVLNKMLTVLVNTLMWDQHASAAGIASLLVCLAGGALYQQAPLRSDGPERSGLLNAKEESDLPPFPSGPSLSDNLHHRCDVDSPEDFSESVRSEAARASPPSS